MTFGFVMAAALWVYYGVTLGMKAGAWGFFAPEIQHALGFTAGDIGLVAGVVFGGTAVFMPIAGFFIARFGSRKSMFIGLALGVFGMLLTSQGVVLWHFIVGAVLLAASTSFGGILPIQTLITHWFKRWRSRVMAVVFTATPIWGAISFQIYVLLMRHMDWRSAVAWLTVIFPIGFALILFFVRNRPEDANETVDGRPSASTATAQAQAVRPSEIDSRTLKQAFLSPMFAVITLSVAISTLPYLFFTTYGRLLIESLNLSTEVAVGALSLITLATLAGRLMVSLGDFVEPVYLIVVTMISNILGLCLMLLFPTPLSVDIASVLLGVSFGLGFLLAPVLVGRYFGEQFFVRLESVRVALVVGFNAGVTPAIGYMVDASGSFVTSVILMIVVQVVSMLGVLGFLIKRRFLKQRAI